MPIEAATLSDVPSIVNGRASTSSTRCASTAASSTDLMDRTMTKSSRPRRASVSRALREHRGVLDRLDGSKDDEVGAAQARQGVLAHQALQPLRDCTQQRVAGAMVERVVHQLEAVEIEAQQRELRAAASGGEDRLPGAVGEQDPVRQPGEGIARREIFDARLRLLAPGDG